MIRAVLFDLYETLVTHFDPDWSPPPRSIAARLGIADADFAAHWPALDRAWQAGAISRYEDALTRLCAAAGGQADPGVLAELACEYRAAYARPFQTIAPEISAMLARLKQSGLKLGLITNASDLDAAPWTGCRLASFFDAVVISHEVRLLKPDARIYALACRRLDVRPSEALFIGDGGADELSGATQAGLRAYWCTWFLERWPAGIRPNGFPGDAWRQATIATNPPYPRLERPSDVLAVIGDGHKGGPS